MLNPIRSTSENSLFGEIFNSTLLWTWMVISFSVVRHSLKNIYLLPRMIRCHTLDFRYFQLPSTAFIGQITVWKNPMVLEHRWCGQLHRQHSRRWLKFCPKQWQENCPRLSKPRRPFALVISQPYQPKKSLISSSLADYFVFWLWVKIISSITKFCPDSSAVRYVLVDFNERARSDHLSKCVGGVSGKGYFHHVPKFPIFPRVSRFVLSVLAILTHKGRSSYKIKFKWKTSVDKEKRNKLRIVRDRNSSCPGKIKLQNWKYIRCFNHCVNEEFISEIFCLTVAIRTIAQHSSRATRMNCF